MRLSLDALAVLDAIDRRGSFAAAAAELHRVPSALTYVVQKLEQDLDVQVFDRSGHRAKLTAAGEELLREGRHLLRAAREVEARVRRVSRGWEIELVIAMDEIVPIERLYPLVAAFHGLGHGTRLKLLEEILAGTWDALLTGRADLVIGASGDPPTDGGCTTAALGSMPFVFAVAPTHPIATEPEPIAHATLLAHRAVLAADSARHLPVRTTGLLTGQDTLTVPSMRAKVAAQVAGLGVGWLPEPLARPEIAAGRLIVREVEEPKPPAALTIAWRGRQTGKALAWFVERLRDPLERERLLGG